MRVAVLALLVGCSFEHGVALDDATGGDIATPDGDGRCGLFLDLCGSPAPPGPLHLVNADTINTDTDPRCLGVMQASGGDVCLVYATMVDIDSGASLTATGTRPLAIAASGALTVGGTIDVSSRISGQRGPASSDTACSFAATPELDLGGAGGGAGGSFGLAGGNGGTGDTDQSQGGSDGMGAPGMAGAPASVTALRGGCRGQAGANEDATGGVGGSGGHSGGALYLYAAESIQISGVIRATGAGGNGGQVQAGGGGGGSGGLVVIESPSIVVTGAISANGGGGGEGGARVGSTPVSGQPGADGMMGTTAAAGGMGSDNRFGYGGAGGASTEAVNGVSAIVAGGGGGGAVGIVRLLGKTNINGVISPPPS